MAATEQTLIGHVTEASGGHITAKLYAEQGFSQTIRVGSEELLSGQPGSYVMVRFSDVKILGQVVSFADGNPGSRLHILPLGELDEEENFTRGVARSPVPGAEVHAISTGMLEVVFAGLKDTGLSLGTLSSRPELKVYLDPTPLFSRHTAILGQSGAGKSWTVTSILQRTVKMMPRAHIVMLDLHGEYGWRDTEGKFHSAFPGDVVRHVDARDLEIPYWLLTYAELIDLLIDRTDANYSIQVSFLREALFNLRRKANEKLDLKRLSVDSPVYFSIKELYMQFKRANEQQLDFGKTKGPLYGAFDEFLVRFQSMFNDSRYDFLFRPKKRTESVHLETLLRDFIGLGDPKRQITVIDLSPVPADVRPVISSQVGRLAFEFNYWNPERREFPVVLVCEEAHQYIPRDTDQQHSGTRKAIERIAKEGRKYGVGLVLISQRPTELSETVLAQCNNFICLRMTNPDDQAYVRKLMPEGEQDMTDVLAALRRGEALAIGEAAPLPTRMQIYKPDPPPMSNDVPVRERWQDGPEDLDVSAIVRNWWNQTR